MALILPLIDEVNFGY